MPVSSTLKERVGDGHRVDATHNQGYDEKGLILPTSIIGMRYLRGTGAALQLENVKYVCLYPQHKSLHLVTRGALVAAYTTLWRIFIHKYMRYNIVI